MKKAVDPLFKWVAAIFLTGYPLQFDKNIGFNIAMKNLHKLNYLFFWPA